MRAALSLILMTASVCASKAQTTGDYGAFPRANYGDSGDQDRVPVIAGETAASMLQLNDEVKLETGDRLIYRVVEDREDPILVFVDVEGNVRLPLIGDVEAVGRTPYELAEQVKEQLEVDFYHQATPLFELRDEQLVRGRVSLLGETRAPGPQPLPADETISLSRFILRAGGATPNGDLSTVALIREGPDGETRQEVDVARMLDEADFSEDPVLLPGDTIIIPARQRLQGTVTVLGAVRQEGEVPITSSDFTVSKALLAVGGLNRWGKGRRVRLIREDPETGIPETTFVDVRRVFEEGDTSEDPIVKPGDMIIVKEKMITFN
jgi:polysaccharide export outer membrane protein